MKIINIDGGLGNQMFKYAFALVLKEKHPNQKILIDTKLCRWRNPQVHNGYELNRLFNLELKEASLWQIFRVSKRAFGILFYKINKKWHQNYIEHFYDNKDVKYIEDYNYAAEFNVDLLENEHSLYYDVGAQSWKYFFEYSDIIKNAFMFKNKLDDRNQKILKEIRTKSSVAIHFRFGDYLQISNLSNVCTLDYYISAIKRVNAQSPDCHYYLFTNDSSYLEKNVLANLSLGFNYTFIDHNQNSDSYKDIILMSNCKYVITANSSFSWWAAWLNNIEDNMIIAPNQWMVNQKFTDICPLNWIRI